MPTTLARLYWAATCV